MANFDYTISELMKFDQSILALRNAVEANDIVKFEEMYELKLPSDYKQLLQITNGFSLMGTEVYGLGLLNNEDLFRVYAREHYEVEYPQYKNLVSFSPDGRGNFYCLNTSQINRKGNCEIIFWTSNYEYTNNDQPEVCNNTFIDWVQEVIIDWTLEDYNYDGSERL